MTASAGLPPQLRQRLRGVHHVALDLDGTLYRGHSLFPSTRPFLASLTGLGIGYSFLTNNSSKSASDYLTHLRRLGLSVDRDQIHTSTHATLAYLRTNRPAIRRLFVLGTPGMCEEVAAAGYLLTADDPQAEPDAVLVGFDLGLSYARLCRAAYWIKSGKPFIATHPDRVCPTDQPTLLVDCGSICAALQAATGRVPDAVLGKPDPRMLTALLHHHQLRPEQLAMAGDRLHTDMAMARQAGALAVLVLTGEATEGAARAHTPPPDLVVPDVGVLGDLLRDAREDHQP